jgi:hypothetical protein
MTSENMQEMVIDVLGNTIQTTITLQDDERVIVLMDEKTVARIILAYRRALAKLRGVASDEVDSPAGER